MASIFGHAIVGYTLSKTIRTNSLKWLTFAAVCSAVLPDIDVVGFKMGIPYSHPLGHRGFTHSIIFSVLWALLLMVLFARQRKLIWFLVVFLATISHGVLDAITSGGMGIGFFIPFDDSRYFFPLRPILVSPIGIERFFSEWGLKVLLSELKYIAIPCLLVSVVTNFLKTYK